MATIIRTFLNSDDHILATKNSFIGLGLNASGRFYRKQYDLKAMAKNKYKTKNIYLIQTTLQASIKLISINLWKEFLQSLVILDEAYFEYVAFKDDYLKILLNYRYDNIILVRTFKSLWHWFTRGIWLCT